MKSNKQSLRSFIAFIVTWAFIVLVVTGLVLYVVPQGRVAYWVHWSLAGMEKEQWGWVHMMFGGVFIVAGILHLYFNWKPFKNYFADRMKGRFELKREVVFATALTIAIFVVSAFNLPPASWVIDLNEWIKDSWVTSPELEPPFGHAEESSLAGISRKMGLDINAVVRALEEKQVKFTGKKDSLENIARANGKTPMEIYEIIRVYKLPESEQTKPLTVEDIEAKYAGTGLGRKTLEEVCGEIGIDLQSVLNKLNAVGIQAAGGDKLREVADEYDKSPIDLMVIILM